MATRRATAVVHTVRTDSDADEAFVGRTDELTTVLDLLDAASVVAVAGLPGVGKSALAQAAARTAVARGWFPGRVLLTDLHGYDPDEAVSPAQLWAPLLRGLGVAAEQVPASESEQATVYHQLLDHLSDAGRPVLLVLDNVADPRQAEMVLPRGPGPHRVLITSRDTLGELPRTHWVDLDVLDPPAAVQLLAVAVAVRLPHDERVAADPAAADRLMRLCGGLPLAVRIVAALAADEPDRPLSELADELADEKHRLAALDYGPRWAVRAAFDLSHRRLDQPQARLFRLLAAVPGTDVSLAVAAAVTDRPPPAVRAGLRALCRAHLLTPQPTHPGKPGRWGMHDLIRLYAQGHLDRQERATGFARILAYYGHTADLAGQRFIALPGQQVPYGFDTAREAMGWVLDERAGLVATVVQAADTHPDDAIRLASNLAPVLHRTRALEDLVTIATAAVQASHLATHTIFAPVAWNNLGNALQEVRRFDDAIAAHERARDLHAEVGDRRGEAQAWNNLGLALRKVRRFDEAIITHAHARDLLAETGDRHSEAQASNNLGNALRQARRFDDAIAAHTHARDLLTEIGDRHGEGQAWGSLGQTLQDVHRFDDAITAHERAIDLFAETGDRHSEAMARQHLGIAYAVLDHRDLARHVWLSAIDLYIQAGDDEAASEVQRWLEELDG